ncbi:metallo-dependent phosphatase [Chloropicon primus]|uniref:Metallo-dependent phosphatase n=2 Tax=Chloropicon primus TaxID=1764295 RepID=A0A5B8MGW4_9CHLO|nr:metallo-dependent phosphatase [Chloropicon primus]UPQ98875.1 metallo-dependent phosphatase [Chloropicon primus]|eukprot:QDZ19663.1 metallo-dependent phosphatase [Chloropicon primus]
MRVLAVSDLHTDYEQNLAWCRQLDGELYQSDVLIIAGDVTHKLDRLEETLLVLKGKFREVFFTPGNHDLWLERDKGGTSIDKLHEVFNLCKRIGVEYRAKKISGVWLIPVLSWYHASWDREADWANTLPPNKVMADFRACKWPEGVGQDDLAPLFDSFNSELDLLETTLALERESAFEEELRCVISFSHFLPRNELLPEKSKLFYKALPKAVGSDFLRKRLEAIDPDVHVFGHTHFSWDCWLDGCRYVQWPLAYPREQERRRKYGYREQFSDSGRGGAGETPCPRKETRHPMCSWKPIVVYDSSQGGITECKPTYWCKFYGHPLTNPQNVKARRRPPAKANNLNQIKSSIRL